MSIPILSDTGSLHITSLAKAEALNNQLASVFTRDNGTDMIDKGPPPYGEMDNIRFTQPGIEKLLKNINQTKAAGPDELSARIL